MWWKPLLLQGCIWKKILDHNVNFPVTGFDFQKRNYWLRNILIRVLMERNVCIPLPFSYYEIRRCWRKKKDIWKYLICLMLTRRSLLLYYFTGRSLSLLGASVELRTGRTLHTEMPSQTSVLPEQGARFCK